MTRFHHWLNRYVRRVGKIVNSFLVMTIFVLYGLEFGKIINIPFAFEILFFFALTVNNLLFLMYASWLKREFDRQVTTFQMKGIPLESTEGFQYSKSAVYSSVSRSVILNILIILGDILNFAPELMNGQIPGWLTFISYFGISMVMIGMSLFLSIAYPDHSLLEPGNFIAYHKPKSYPTFLDNVLADSLKSFLDPRTRFNLDDWLLDIEDKLRPDFESGLPMKTRVDRAIERIILVLYLKRKVPDLVTEQVVKDHLRQIVRFEEKSEFIDGIKSGLPLKIFSQLIDRMMKDVPEIFRLVDRLLVEIMVNPSLFMRSDKIIETVIPDQSELGIKESFRILVFVLNMTTSPSKRIVEVIAESSRHIEPPVTTIQFELDAPEQRMLELITSHDEVPHEKIYSHRIIEIISTMLQVGDSAWISLIPQEYGNHVLNLAVRETRGANKFQTFGRSIPLDVQFSLVNNIKKLMSSLSGVGGAIYPVFKALFLSPIL